MLSRRLIAWLAAFVWAMHALATDGATAPSGASSERPQ
jgi:hypothetical protein